MLSRLLIIPMAVAVFSIAISAAQSAMADQPSEVGVGLGFDRGTVDIHASKGGSDSAVVPVQKKHGTGGPVAAGEIVCHEYSDGEIINPCWNPTPADCFGQGLDTNAGVNRCPTAVPVAAGPAASPQQSPRQYAIDYFRSLPLPVPKPVMSAPEGICGAQHSLDLQIPQQMVFTDPETPFGSLAVHVHGSFTVNWGDGRTDTYSSSGAPWPTSTLVHYWENKGRNDITVTANWSANWTYGTHSGTLGGLSTTSRIPGWGVIELQAVLIE
jgi:hypothetical protein